MRPDGSTAVCSTMTSPAPDSDNEPKCWRCQSFAAPFSALYWHIGDTAIRLARVMPPIATGVNKWLMDLSARMSGPAGPVSMQGHGLIVPRDIGYTSGFDTDSR